MITETGDSVFVNLHFDALTHRPVCDPFVDGGAGDVFELVTSPVYVVRPGIRNYNDAYAVPEIETWEPLPGETVEDLMYRIGGITGNVDLARSILITSRGRSGIISYIPGASARVYVERAGGKLYNENSGGTTVTRDGVLIASGEDALNEEVLPGDVIEVPYNWVAQHAQEIGILATVVGITSVIINLSR